MSDKTEMEQLMGKLLEDVVAGNGDIANHPALRAIGARGLELLRAADNQRRARSLEGHEAFVCFMDVDGFAAAVNRDAQDLYERYERIARQVHAVAAAVRSIGLDERPNTMDRLVLPTAFSDSWVFTSVELSEDSLRQISTTAAMTTELFLGEELVCRGVIATGRAWWNPERAVLISPALIEAYRLSEQLGVFGVVATEAVSDLAEGWPDALTRPVRVSWEERTGQDITTSHAEARCAYIGAWPTEFDLSESRGLEHFLQMRDRYVDRPPAERKDHVVRRYEGTEAVLGAMLQRIS